MKDSDGHSADSRTVRVEGIRADTTNDTLEIFFENKKKSGGGDICETTRSKGSSTALIEFLDVTGKSC